MLSLDIKANVKAQKFTFLPIQAAACSRDQEEAEHLVAAADT